MSAEGGEEDLSRPVSGLRKRGKSKNGTWNPQVVVALAVTREGFPVRSWVFPGNTADVTTIETVKKDLSGWQLNRCLFVADAGMNSEDNRKRLSLGGGKYLPGCQGGERQRDQGRSFDPWRTIQKGRGQSPGQRGRNRHRGLAQAHLRLLQPEGSGTAKSAPGICPGRAAAGARPSQGLGCHGQMGDRAPGLPTHQTLSRHQQGREDLHRHSQDRSGPEA
ncbi:hypothetical protein TRIP_B120014 [uncultured Desulfatiglans sp.]|uniref:Transposase IS4-like domain-containing protein n=1 Tax=Uncultured Desulfatiglans sp. TaxID=1748965 RepID=A0A653A0M6_UNCDX|nr:hypothetical protein TRIP_B120014 [uncultured Desulfatiglans sp.]